MTEPYDMRSNIKGKPGSQGTLFQVRDKGLLNPQQRWPQGYTPERLNEVRQATRTTAVSGPEEFYDQPSDETQQRFGVNEYGYREHVNREIAKTTIPGTDLAGIQSIHARPERGQLGTYWPSRKELGVNLVQKDTHGEIDLPHEGGANDIRKTLTHEIGHHVDHTTQRNQHLYDLTTQLHAHRAIENNEWRDTPTETDVYTAKAKTNAGVGEAVADNYAVEHYRTGGRKSTGTSTGAYEDGWLPKEIDAMYPGYTDVRPPQASLQPAQFQPGLFSEDAAKAGTGTPLQRRLAAQKDANRRAVGDNL